MGRVAPGAGEQDDRLAAGMRPVGMHPRGRGRRLDMPAGLDPDLEAISLMTMSAGLGTSVLGGHSSAGQAQAVIDYHLDRLLPRPGQRS